jgi:hypothetical protein
MAVRRRPMIRLSALKMSASRADGDATTVSVWLAWPNLMLSRRILYLLSAFEDQCLTNTDRCDFDFYIRQLLAAGHALACFGCGSISPCLQPGVVRTRFCESGPVTKHTHHLPRYAHNHSMISITNPESALEFYERIVEKGILVFPMIGIGEPCLIRITVQDFAAGFDAQAGDRASNRLSMTTHPRSAMISANGCQRSPPCESRRHFCSISMERSLIASISTCLPGKKPSTAKASHCRHAR